MNMPESIILEKPARNLDALVTSAAIQKLRDTLLHEWRNRDSFFELQQYGIRPTNAAVFFGPPGNGKTVAAKLLAGELDCPLYRVASESLLSSYLGQTEGNMGRVMNWCEQQGQAIILFDECENLFRARGSASGGSVQAVERSMQVFWQRLDRWESPQLFIFATNLIDDLDDALKSRIELHLEFGPPTVEQAIMVVEYWAETLHEYGAAAWSAALLKRIRSGQCVPSFRDLWQTISAAVRQHVLAET